MLHELSTGGAILFATMHYKNGREAKNGDKVVLIDGYGASAIGILYDATAGNDHCNGKLAVIRPNDPCPNLKDCLHLDDVKAAIAALTAPPVLAADGSEILVPAAVGTPDPKPTV